MSSEANKSEETGTLSLQETGQRLGFSERHVRRLIEAGILEAEQPAGSENWWIQLDSVVRLEEERERARRQADDWSRELDRFDTPLE